MVKLKKIPALFLLALMTVTVFAFFPAQSAFADEEYTRYAIVLEDYDDCLDSDEIGRLRGIMQTAANKIQCDIGIVITADLQGKTDNQYANDFGYDNFGDGDWIVLMLLNTHGNPEYTYYTDKIIENGLAHDKFSKRTDKIFDALYMGLGDNEYNYHFFDACDNFCGALVKYGGTGVTSTLIVLGEFILNHSFVITGALIVSVIFTIIRVGKTASGYKKKVPLSAAKYLDTQRTRVTRCVDQFVREYTTSVHLSSSSGSHHGGGHGGGGHHSSHSGRHR